MWKHKWNYLFYEWKKLYTVVSGWWWWCCCCWKLLTFSYLISSRLVLSCLVFRSYLPCIKLFLHICMYVHITKLTPSIYRAEHIITLENCEKNFYAIFLLFHFSIFLLPLPIPILKSSSTFYDDLWKFNLMLMSCYIIYLQQNKNCGVWNDEGRPLMSALWTVLCHEGEQHNDSTRQWRRYVWEVGGPGWRREQQCSFNSELSQTMKRAQFH